MKFEFVVKGNLSHALLFTSSFLMAYSFRRFMGLLLFGLSGLQIHSESKENIVALIYYSEDAVLIS